MFILAKQIPLWRDLVTVAGFFTLSAIFIVGKAEFLQRQTGWPAYAK